LGMPAAKGPQFNAVGKREKQNVENHNNRGSGRVWTGLTRVSARWISPKPARN
jgi:hypothetical protein